MSKGKAAVVTAIVIVGLTAALLFVASATNLLLTGDYYVKIDNAHISKNESSGGVVNFRSDEPYLYKLEAVNAAGDKTEIEFGAYRELRQDALLKLELQPIRGVVGWSEISEDALPAKVAEALG
ncbi:YxeA family protein [Adlercreutzia agrestimuris]|uniref:YxeA family protein n=1 Tax=Adlercreutzia agrestimuris TaxID=2941324 RepID=UPI00203EAEB1|nr:YxeA family protein [Adlercreutzia agrestimuris]